MELIPQIEEVRKAEGLFIFIYECNLLLYSRLPWRQLEKCGEEKTIINLMPALYEAVSLGCPYTSL